MGLFFFFTFVPVVYADIGSDWNNLIPGCVTPEGVATLQCLPAVFQNIITAALVFVGIVAVFLIIFSGIKFITSSGDAKQVEGARKTLTYAIVGVLVVLLSFFIINFIADFTGVHCIQVFGFGSCG